LKSRIFTLLTDLFIAGIEVKYIRCDDSGESISLCNACCEEGFEINFEFSGPQTPQRKDKMERISNIVRKNLSNVKQLRLGKWS
jgi:hypothetical protein